MNEEHVSDATEARRNEKKFPKNTPNFETLVDAVPTLVVGNIRAEFR